MRVYEVGGAVRDQLLGKTADDIDYVVVGATEESFCAAHPDARKVGRSFPVYLWNGSEYAFARRERKTGTGHTAFSVDACPDVPLEADLSRRDLTINAMARDPQTGRIIDPYDGQSDLRNKILRHVSDAFSEDPLRAYRTARFAALFPDFTVARETRRKIADTGSELTHLSVERVWKETEKALCASAPWRFFSVLNRCRILQHHFQEIAALCDIPAGPPGTHVGEPNTLDHTYTVMKAAKTGNALLQFGALCHDLGKGMTNPEDLPHHHGHDTAGITAVQHLTSRLKTPTKFIKSGTIAAQYHMLAHTVKTLRPATAIRMLTALRSFPAGGITGFFNLVCADGAQNECAALHSFVQQVVPVLDMTLPEKHRGKGKQSGEILLQMQVEKYKEITGR